MSREVESMTSFLERYQRGECEQVWAELFALGTTIHSQPLYRDAFAVAQETMRRVRVNIEMTIPCLEQLGYQFGYEWMNEWPDGDEDWIASQPARYTPPPSDITHQLELFERETGPFPLSIRAFYLEAGSVNFVGTHPEWEALASEYNPFHQAPEGLDPLFVWGFDEGTLTSYTDWQEMSTEEEDKRPFHLPIAPDYDLKYNASGGGFYEMELPNAAIDGLLLNEWHQTTFVDYLRHCFRYGGLPGLERIRSEIADELVFLRKDLLPI